MMRTMTAMATLLVSAALHAQAPLVVKEEKAGQLKMATVKPEVALATAKAKVPNGVLKSAEIEQEDGKLVYAFAFTVAKKTGEDEVLVDAKTGKVVSVEHETPEKEEAEEKAEAAEKKGAAKAPVKAPAKPPAKPKGV